MKTTKARAGWYDIEAQGTFFEAVRIDIATEGERPASEGWRLTLMDQWETSPISGALVCHREWCNDFWTLTAAKEAAEAIGAEIEAGQ